MHINIDKLVSFLIIWLIPLFSVLRRYFKMDKEEKNAALTTLKSPQFLFTRGIILLGLFLATLGRLLSIIVLQVIGCIPFIIGGVVYAVRTWQNRKGKSIIILVSVLFATFVILW
ncbi:hypothetical protein [Bacillus multifaciens]|uniref:hypothetical protein n=1 Tax=Bacillus multifaciens TaxID=3068506 RepID=UPI0027413C83|nr:hypothetical protein [Bacillus sp. WLY-B-L8]HDX9587438.1 hypothetical protein [Bacillus pseudomycoides]